MENVKKPQIGETVPKSLLGTNLLYACPPQLASLSKLNTMRS